MLKDLNPTVRCFPRRMEEAFRDERTYAFAIERHRRPNRWAVPVMLGLVVVICVLTMIVRAFA